MVRQGQGGSRYRGEALSVSRSEKSDWQGSSKFRPDAWHRPLPIAASGVYGVRELFISPSAGCAFPEVFLPLAVLWLHVGVGKKRPYGTMGGSIAGYQPSLARGASYEV